MGIWAEADFIVSRGNVGGLSKALFAAGSVGLEEAFLPGEAPPVRQPWDTGPPPPSPKRRVIRAWWAGEGFVRRVPELEALAQDAGGKLESWRLIPDEGWDTSWREGFERIEIGGVFAVAPPWKAQAGDVIIEPGMAFGTGEHPSTRACLEAISRWAMPNKRCLDVGCGSGILALSAARLGMEARGIDIDPKVIDAARSNARLNGFDVDFDLIPLEQIEGSFDLVVANLYAELQLSLAPHLLRLASSRLVLAGILSERQALLSPMLRDFEHVRIHHTDGWVCLELER